jgi:chain length determinant protein tyrosine kinase EpsG
MKFPFFSSTGPASGKRGGRNSGFTSLDIPAITVPPQRSRREQPPPPREEPVRAPPVNESTPFDEGPRPNEPEFVDVPPPGTIGEILVNARRISIADARRIVSTQIEFNEPFGETAVRLGLVTHDDVQFALSRQFALPRLVEGDDAIDPEVIAAFHPGHQLVERLRNLRGQIAMRALDATPPLRSVAIMGTEHGVGRSFIAANLATVFAQLGARTLLIDADFIRPRQHKLFRLTNRTGLSSILAGRAKLNAVCPVHGVPGFAVLPAGPRPPNPDDLIARPTLSHFLRRCEHDFDVIVLDTPSWRDGSSARMVAAAAGAAVLLVQEGKTGAADASEVGRELENVNAKLLGVVLNRP